MLQFESRQTKEAIRQIQSIMHTLSDEDRWELFRIVLRTYLENQYENEHSTPAQRDWHEITSAGIRRIA